MLLSLPFFIVPTLNFVADSLGPFLKDLFLVFFTFFLLVLLESVLILYLPSNGFPISAK